MIPMPSRCRVAAPSYTAATTDWRAMASLAAIVPPAGSDPLAVLDAFGEWAVDSGRPLYAHQDEAALALAAGDHVVLATPTGSGKSLVAVAGVLLARNEGRRAVWTAPIKALVAEKFFDLVDLLGADNVGLATGDAAINVGAPVLVCTAEVLANHALVTGPASDFGFACLDEFHYYGDGDRGWAWQVPLLELTNCQMLLASATLGDMTAITTDLAQRSGRAVTEVTSVDRPTPLYHQWRTTPVAESVREAVADGLSPVYVVHANQAAAIERAQGLVNLNVTTRAQREAIAAAMAEVRMGRGFGDTLNRLVRNGVGVHHAGMLPRYRRLVERLAGQGLLPVICGTDTLGVGVNIPIRTVLDDRAHQVRRHTRATVHGPRVPPAGRAGGTARLRSRRPRVGAGARPRDRERPGARPRRRRSQGPPQGDQGAAAGRLRPLRRGRDAAPGDLAAGTARVDGSGSPPISSPPCSRAPTARRRSSTSCAPTMTPSRAGANTSGEPSPCTAASKPPAWPSASVTSTGGASACASGHSSRARTSAARCGSRRR